MWTNSDNKMSISYRDQIIDVYDNIGRTAVYKGKRGRIQGIAIGNDDQICYVVEKEESGSDKWKTALFPIDGATFYDTKKIIDACNYGTNYNGQYEYFGCSPCTYCTYECPATICGKIPKDFYGVSTCRQAMMLDKLYKARDDIRMFFDHMESKEGKYNNQVKENR